MRFYDLYDAKHVFSGSELNIFGGSDQFSAHQKMAKIGQKVKSNPFTFWPILAILSSAEKCPKIHFYAVYDARIVFYGSELTIFGIYGQFSLLQKMDKISQKVKGLPFTFWPIFAIFWCAENSLETPKMVNSDQEKNVFCNVEVIEENFRAFFGTSKNGENQSKSKGVTLHFLTDFRYFGHFW